MNFGVKFDDEKEVLSKLISGDEAAFSYLYFKYSPKLYANILRLIKCEETSKEILQELFLKIWENRLQIDVTKSFKSYLFTIAQNLVYDHFRKAARDKRLADYLISCSVLSYSNPHAMLVYDENLQFINQAIDQLSPVRKKVFLLSKMEGKSYEEIASIMNISASTISDHIVKANRAVRKYLQENSDLSISLLVLILLNDL